MATRGLATWESPQFPSVTCYGAYPLRGYELRARWSNDEAAKGVRVRTPRVSVCVWSVCMYVYIYICCKVKKWSNFLPFLKLKSGPLFLFFLGFYFSKNLVLPCRKKRIFEKHTKNKQQKKHNFKVKKWSNYVAQHNWTTFNFNLAHFLTLEFCFFFFYFFFGWNPYFYSVFRKNAKLKETQKRKKDTICEHNCAISSCQNVRFFCIFDFCCFSNFHVFQRCFLTGFQKSKNNKIWKQLKQKTTTRKQDAKQK